MSRKDVRSHKKVVEKDKLLLKKWEQNQLDSSEETKVLCPHTENETCYRCLVGPWLKTKKEN